jgi:hypothetical protein
MLAAPALASVTISIEPNMADPNSFYVRYAVAGEPNHVRGFALDIFLDTDVNIVDVNEFHVGESNSVTPGYGVFPSNFAEYIDPEDPDWDNSDYTPLADPEDYPDDTLAGLDTNGITVELGSLYVGEANAPTASGTLLEFTVESNQFKKISLALNQIRGGVVLEDPDQSPSGVYLADYNECLIGGNADGGVPGKEYAAWVQFGEPYCWCFARQCRGDVDGIRTGPYWVTLPDLGIFATAYRKNDVILATVPNGICADLDHYKTGPYRVTIPDLNILATYYRKSAAAVPICDQSPVITGPYDHWEVP